MSQQSPWKVVNSGCVSTGGGNVSYQSSNGYYWYSTLKQYATDVFAYDTNFDHSGFQPSTGDVTWYGMSVRKVVSFTHFFTPYGYKFESKSWSADLIAEQFTVTSVNPPAIGAWKFNSSGVYYPEDGELQVSRAGRYWTESAVMGGDYRAYDSTFIVSSPKTVTPANYAIKSYANSVRVLDLTVLCTERP